MTGKLSCKNIEHLDDKLFQIYMTDRAQACIQNILTVCFEYHDIVLQFQNFPDDTWSQLSTSNILLLVFSNYKYLFKILDGKLVQHNN